MSENEGRPRIQLEACCRDINGFVGPAHDQHGISFAQYSVSNYNSSIGDQIADILVENLMGHFSKNPQD